MHPATVEILISKGGFEPAVAMAVAEALDMTIQNAQLVTVPILEARFAAAEANINARFAAADANFSARFAGMEASASARFAEMAASVSARFAEMAASVSARFAEMQASVSARFAASDKSISARFGEVDLRFAELRGAIQLLDERMKRRELRYILCTTAIVVGNSHLGEFISFVAGVLRRLPN
jgi:colicin import membrane protein